MLIYIEPIPGVVVRGFSLMDWPRLVRGHFL